MTWRNHTEFLKSKTGYFRGLLLDPNIFNFHKQLVGEGVDRCTPIWCVSPPLLVSDICSFSYNRSFCFKQNVTWRHKYDVIDPVLTSYYVTISIWCQTVVFISSNTPSRSINEYLSLIGQFRYTRTLIVVCKLALDLALFVYYFWFVGYKIGNEIGSFWLIG